MTSGDASDDANGHARENGNGHARENGNGHARENGNGHANGDADRTTDGKADVEEVLIALRSVVTEADPVPAPVLAAARAAFDLRSLDTDLAELVADSLDTAKRVRGPSGRRQLAFAAGAVTLDVEVTADGGRRRLLGFAEGTPGPVSAEASAGGTAAGAADPVTAGLDELGRFVLDGLPPGPIRLRCPGAGGRAVVTPWTVL